MSRPSSEDHCGPRLSVAIIVRDDAAGLAETLASIDAVADEVVVLDAISHDGSQDVARRHGARLIERPWEDDFAAARNICLQYTTGDWVLWLDASERLAPDGAKLIRSLIANPGVIGHAYRVTVRVPPPSADAQAEQIAPVRLVPRHPELRFVGRVRESLHESLDAAGIVVQSSPILVERGPREHDPQRKATKARRDLRLAQRDLAKRGDCAALLLAKGEALAALDNRPDAIDLLRLAVTGAAPGSTTQLAAYGALLATLDGLKNPAGDTLGVRVALGLEALNVFPLDAQLLMAMGGYLQAQGNIELAARSFRLAWEHGTVSPDVWHVADARSLAASCLALMLQMLARDDEAVDVLEAALAGALDEARLRRRLMEIHIRANRRDAALAQAERLANAAGQPGFRAAVRGACLAAANEWAPAIAQLETAYRQGCRDVLCQRAYVTALLATDQSTSAVAVLDDWLAAEPHCAEAHRLRAVATSTSATTAHESAPTRPANVARTDSAHTDPAHAHPTHAQPSAMPRPLSKSPRPSPSPSLRVDRGADDGTDDGIGTAHPSVPQPRLPTDAPAPSRNDASR